MVSYPVIELDEVSFAPRVEESFRFFEGELIHDNMFGFMVDFGVRSFAFFRIFLAIIVVVLVVLLHVFLLESLRGRYGALNAADTSDAARAADGLIRTESLVLIVVARIHASAAVDFVVVFRSTANHFIGLTFFVIELETRLVHVVHAIEPFSGGESIRAYRRKRIRIFFDEVVLLHLAFLIVVALVSILVFFLLIGMRRIRQVVKIAHHRLFSVGGTGR